MKVLKEDNQFTNEEVRKIFGKILDSKRWLTAYIQDLESMLPDGEARYTAEKVGLEIGDLIEELRNALRK